VKTDVNLRFQYSSDFKPVKNRNKNGCMFCRFEWFRDDCRRRT